MSQPGAADTFCEECNQHYRLGRARAGQSLKCRRCGHALRHVPRQPLQAPLALAIAALSLFPLIFCFSFLGISQGGNTTAIEFWQTTSGLTEGYYYLVATLLVLGLMLFPLIDLVIIAYLYGQLALGHKPEHAKPLLLVHHQLRMWLMVDVFLIGVLVALVKITAYADIQFGLSFWAFCLFVCLYLATLTSVDRHYLYQQCLGPLQTVNPAPNQPLWPCSHCHQLNLEPGRCRRCQASLQQRKAGGLERPLAFLLAAVVLYIPANVHPIMTTSTLGVAEPSTILGGVVLLWQLEDYPIALVIFIASVFVPIAKMIAIAWLCWTVYRRQPHSPQEMTRMYRITEFIGRWSMIDVFVVALLAALIQIQGLANVTPGPAAVSFAAVVVLTMLAAASFDPRLIWDHCADASHG
ncbi:paraquat-inducible protein A [Ferrimonas marina]|uniref:Paraquat-inducible protein A n=1 Tax=Ferrimonas marina TaxID=299255 RepID=A0A1M5YV07_9GAMM|nr:paraquat-inducible protein A [Ferrimonas marina]SHI15825.1 paraquat-inducible protein A [Ferrimonas marina]